MRKEILDIIYKLIDVDEDVTYVLADIGKVEKIEEFNNRIEAFNWLLDKEILNIDDKIVTNVGTFNIVNIVNSILDGKINVGRFNFFRECDYTLTFEQQILLLDKLKIFNDGEVKIK